MLASFVPPVLPLLRGLYRVAIWWFVERLGRFPFVRTVLLTGSVAIDDCVYGASDLDFIVLVEGRRDRLPVKRALRATFRRGRRWFPVVGAIEERAHNVFFVDELDRDRYAAILKCRIKTGHVRVLRGDPAPRLSGALLPEEVVAEIALQVKSVANKILERDLNLYFWKAKIRVLLALCGADAGWRAVVPLLDRPAAELLQTLFTASNRRLFFARGDRENRLAWEIVSRLCRHLAELHGLRELPSRSIAFRSTPAPQCALRDLPSLPECVAPHSLASTPGRFGGPLILSTSTSRSLLLELRGETLGDLTEALRAGRAYNLATPAGETLLWWGDYVFQVTGKSCVGVFSRWDSPHLFAESCDESGTIAYPEAFLRSLLLERDSDLEYLKGFYRRLAAPETATDDAHLDEDSLRYFENRGRVLNGFATIHLLLALSEDGLVNFGTLRQVFEDAASTFPRHAETLRQLAKYTDAVAARSLDGAAHELPPGLLRAGIRFFGDRLYGREVGADYAVGARLKLSLCVCTRNRAHELDDLLASVLGQCRLPDEVVIVDNASTDRTRDVVEAFARRLGAVPLRYVVDESRTIGKLRNRAVAEASGDVICFTDDDCVLEQGWFRNIEETFLLEDGIGAVGGLMCHYVEHPDRLLDVFHQEYLGRRL